MTLRHFKILIPIIILKNYDKIDIFILTIQPLITIYLEKSQCHLDILVFSDL